MDRIFERKPGGVNVTVSGDNPHAVKTTAAVIGESLDAVGFTNVTVTNPFNPQSQKEYSLDSASMLDLMRLERPEMFNTPVSVQYLVPEDDDGVHMGEVVNVADTPAGVLVTSVRVVAAEPSPTDEVSESTAQAEADEADIAATTVELTYLSPEDQQLAHDMERERKENT